MSAKNEIGEQMKMLRNPARRWSVLKSMLLALLLAAVPAHGMIYMWKDSAGIAHYSNKEYDVPARYKTKVKLMCPEASDAGTVQPGNVVQAAPVVQPDVRPVAPPAQVISTTPKTPEQRSRRKRERNRDDDE